MLSVPGKKVDGFDLKGQKLSKKCPLLDRGLREVVITVHRRTNGWISKRTKD